MTPVEVVRLWFDAHARGDLDAARQLMSPDAWVDVPGARLRGFDAFMDWYHRRRESEGRGFSYRLDDLLAGDAHAAALLTLTDGRREWRQVAVYDVRDDCITALWAAEGDLTTD